MSRANSASSKQQANAGEAPALAPVIKHGLWVLFLFALAVLLGLALFGLAGVWGEVAHSTLMFLFGWGGYAVPVLLVVIAMAVLQAETSLGGWRWAGLLLLVVGVSGLLHSVVPPAERWNAARDGYGGGYIGYVVLYPLVRSLGVWGAVVLLIAVGLGGVLVLFEMSLPALGKRAARLWGVFRAPATPPQIKWPAPPLMPALPAVEAEPHRTAFQTKVVEHAVKQQPTLPLKTAATPRPQLTLDLLADRIGAPAAGDITANMEKIRHTLENFGIAVEMGGVNVGPTVTQYTLAPAEGVKLSQITALANDLALALAAHPIRIEAPIPGQSLAGIEVPNQTVAPVGLKEVLGSEEFKHRGSNLTVALGKDVAGKPFVADIGHMPHLLIAGATGSGKSVCINSIIISLLYTNSPDELKFIIVDPKRVELSSYNDIPHLLTPVVTDINKTINALKWVVGEMDRRYHVLSGAGKRNIEAYNQSSDERLPYLLVVIDELADLMAVAAADVEAAIIRLAQMARAVGIHLIVATQRPSVDVITGLIKANITSRIAFAVASGTDSRTILDNAGAEKLLGRGDCLYISAELSKPKRLQGAFIGDEEIERVTASLKQQARPDYDPSVVQRTSSGSTSGGLGAADGDDLLGEARAVVVRAGKASASLLQRRLRVGYARAARLLDLLEEQGIIGPGDGAKPREVLVSRSEVEDDLIPDDTLGGESEEELGGVVEPPEEANPSVVDDANNQ